MKGFTTSLTQYWHHSIHYTKLDSFELTVSVTIASIMPADQSK